MSRSSFRIRHGQPTRDYFSGEVSTPAIAVFPSNYSTPAGSRTYRPELVKVSGFQGGCQFSDGSIYGSNHGTLYKQGVSIK